MMTWSRDVLSERLLETSDIFKNIVLEWKKNIVCRYCKENQDVLPTKEITDYRRADICNIV